MEFPGVFKKKSCGISMGLSFDLSRGAGSAQLCRTLKLVFTGISEGKVTSLKISDGVEKSISSTAPVWVFSGIAQSPNMVSIAHIIWLNWWLTGQTWDCLGSQK